MLHTKKRNRLILITATIAVLAFTCFLVLKNIKDNIVFFYTPTEINNGVIDKAQTLRIGGLVKPGSITKQEQNNVIITTFVITDCTHDMKIIFDKTLPNLFREKQGIVALGKFDRNNNFIATELLTKHSEVYTPPNSAEVENLETYCYKK